MLATLAGLLAAVSGCVAPSPPTSTVPPGDWRLDGQVTTFVGDAGECSTVDGSADVGRFRSPHAIAADRDGLWVADVFDNVIRRASFAGDVTTIAGAVGELGLVDGTGADARLGATMPTMASSDDGTLYFTDVSHHVIRRMSSDGTVTTIAGAPWSGSSDVGPLAGPAAEVFLFSPFAVALNGPDLLVADVATLRQVAGDHVSVLVDTTGGLIPSVLSTAVGPDGTIWITSFTAVYRLGQNGTPVLVAGDPAVQGHVDGAGDVARFTTIAGSAIGPDGALYLAGDDVVRRVDTDGTTSTVAGSPGEFGYAEGAGSEARFQGAASLDFGPDGALYVADVGNCAIRRIT